MRENFRPFSSPLAHLLHGLVREKQDGGYSYATEIELLRHLDRMWSEPGAPPPALTMEWADRYLHENPASPSGWNVARRGYVWRHLARFALRKGLDAYCPEPCTLTKVRRGYTPFIYTRPQLRALFDVADALEATRGFTHRAQVYGLLLRLLYGAGLRMSEGMNLRRDDFDPQSHAMTIRKSKNGKTRVIPVAESLANRIKEHMDRFPGAKESAIFFSLSRTGGRLNSQTIWAGFPEILRRAGLPPRINRTGPRLHDLRHTFAVHRMENWLRGGEVLEAKMPMLSTYMGHTNMADTYYYLRITRQLFPTITQRLQAHVEDVIPSMGGVV